MSRFHTGIVVTALAAGLGGLLAGDAGTVGLDNRDTWHPAWSEVKWPFPMDQWGHGRAFRCEVADCGVEIKLYLRAKIGFCNCTTGVSDNDELDRVGDLELFSGEWVGLADGHPIRVGWMNGRSRSFRVEMRYAEPVH